MKISLVVPNYMCSRTFLQPPVELYTSAALIEKCGYSVEVYDFRILNQTAIEAARTISDDTDIIIISVSPYDMAQMYHMDYRYRYVEHFTKIVKQIFPNVYVFGEGAQCTLKPEYFLERTGADGVILWEIEYTLCELVEAVASHMDLTKIPNLVFRTGGHHYIRTEFSNCYAHPNTKYFDVIPKWESVDFSKYFGYDLEKTKHTRLNYWGVILGSRGCAFSCSFCFNFYKKNTRYRNVRSIVDEMELLQRSGVQRVFFLDMTFSQNRQWAISLCNEMIVRNNQLKWLCQTRCDCVDEELLLLMKRAGCCGVEFGVETYDDNGLAKLNKQIDTSLIVDTIHLCQKYNIATSAFLMVGTPYDSEESIHSTMDMLKRHGIAFIPIIYTPRIGSELGNSIATQYNADDWNQLLGLRGKLSDQYHMINLIKDHSIMKGESMGTVSTDFENMNLKCDMSHHRLQFTESPVITEQSDLADYIRNGEVKRQEQDMPFVSFPIVSNCPFSCIYCGQGGENTISPVSTMKLETLMDIAVHLKRAGVKKVRLTGGEPLCHPQIGDIIRFLSESGFYVLINTNGLLIEDKVDSLMRTASNIHFAVSLDTLDSAKFDKISRTTGNFDKVMRGIEILKELGYLMRINMVVGVFNLDEVNDVIDFCRKIGCDLKLQEVASVPYPNSEWNDIHVDLSCLESVLGSKAKQIIVHDYARSFGIPVKVFDMDGVFVTLKSMGVGSRYDTDGICKDCPHLLCHEGLYDIYILADGSIATCRWCRFGSLETFGEDLNKAINAFQNAEYIGKHKLTKMTRVESNNERVNRL